MAWKKIKQNENYSINENGEIRNDNTNKILTAHVNSGNGYVCIDLYCNNKRTKYCVHRLLAEAFLPNPENKPCIDHIDGNRQNNALENLRWATYSENNSRFGTLGVFSHPVIVKHYEEERSKRGGGHIKWLGVIEEKKYDRIKDVAAVFGVSVANISMMLKHGEIGRRGKMRGFQFEYAER
jgi:hypothetical protein